MTSLLLLHSALGLRPAVTDFAAALRERGHAVLAPDFYDGRVFDDTAEGLAHRDEVGGRTLLARLRPVLDDLPDDAALGGFSLGAAFALHLAQRRPRAGAVVLLHHATRPRDAWPGQPVQVHRHAEDPFVDPDDLAALAEAVRASGAAYEDHVTPGRGHLFTDLGLPGGDPEATAATIARVDDFLSRSTTDH